jgi:histidyl-tRNA synthetase
MKKSYTPLRGFRYFRFIESNIFNIITEKFLQILKKNNIQMIHLPILAKTEIFDPLGKTSDIVNKELYNFIQKDGENVCLVPEYTRIFVEQVGYFNVKKGKFAYLGPCFRYERPQFGRYRSFYQIGVEVIGETSYMSDVELILFLEEFFHSLNLKDYILNINFIGTIEDRQSYEKTLKEYFTPFLKEMSTVANFKYERGAFLRMLDSKDEKDLFFIDKAPKIYESLKEESKNIFNKIKKTLDDFNIKYVENPFLVRGLDYYNNLVFEYTHQDLGAQSSFCGGGRYDGLLPEILSENIPAIGFGVGVDRLIHILEKNQDFLEEYINKNNKIYILPIEETEYSNALEIKKIIDSLNRFSSHILYDKKLSKRLEEANKNNINIVIIFGENEIKKNQVIVKNMKENKWEEVSINNLKFYFDN